MPKNFDLLDFLKKSLTAGKNSRSLKILPSSGTKPCVLLSKTRSSWRKLDFRKKTHNSRKKFKVLANPFGGVADNRSNF